MLNHDADMHFATLKELGINRLQWDSYSSLWSNHAQNWEQDAIRQGIIDILPQSWLWFSSTMYRSTIEHRSPHIEAENGGYIDIWVGSGNADHGLWTMTTPKDINGTFNTHSVGSQPGQTAEIIVLAPLEYFLYDETAPGLSSLGPIFEKGRLKLVARQKVTISGVPWEKGASKDGNVYCDRYYVVPESIEGTYFEALDRQPGITHMPDRHVELKPSTFRRDFGYR